MFGFHTPLVVMDCLERIPEKSAISSDSNKVERARAFSLTPRD
jgi:hypothetical protein